MSIFMLNRLNLKIKTHINATESAHCPFVSLICPISLLYDPSVIRQLIFVVSSLTLLPLRPKA